MLKHSFLLLVLLLPACTAAAASPASSPEIKRQAAEHGEGLWKQIATSEPRAETGSRGIIGYALALCEARMHPERLHRLFALVRSMQDNDPKSKNCGNLKWYWRDQGVTDANAIEFCMQDALTISARHGEWLPADARDELNAFIRQGVHGCLQHRVPTDYTNIAILNSGNLIVAGERFNRPDAAEEGRSRLDGILLYTAAFGIHEYDSPTYYGTDLSGLLMLHTLGKEARERDQAEAMLKLFWTDIAANWLPDQEKLGGCHSRSYDYLRGLGALDWHLWAQGWLHEDKLPGGKPPGAERREPWGDEWMVPADIIDLRDAATSRFVEQRWGPLPAEVRWNWTFQNTALSCAGSCYGSQDCPLTIDVGGERNASRCYFIADGREDPYGKKKFATGSAKHMKALHLQPFWAGAQDWFDALGMVLYRPNDLTDPQLTRLQSHLVLRRPSGGIWRGGKLETLAPPEKNASANSLTIAAGQSLVLRCQDAAIAIRVPWTYHAKGLPAAQIALVDDGNEFDCLRLTIDHGAIDRSAISKVANTEALAGAAVFISMRNSFGRDKEDFDIWRSHFETVVPSGAQRLRGLPPGILPNAAIPNDLIAVESAEASPQRTESVGPPDFILRVNGHEFGRPLLEAVEPLRSAHRGIGFWKPIEVKTQGATEWRASDGLVLPGMKIIAVSDVSSCVLQEPSVSGQPVGSVWWSLHAKKAGHYYLSARLQSRDKTHGSFLVAASDIRGPLSQPTEWTLRSASKWSWQLLRDAAGHPQAIDLPEGDVLLQLKTKASGTALDRIKLSTDAN